MATLFYQGANWAELIQTSVIPWIEAQNSAGTLWRKKQPTAIVVPSAAWIHAIKNKMAELHIEALGLHFWTHRELQSQLAFQFEAEDLFSDSALIQLLITSAASELAAKSQKHLLHSIARDPNSFYHAYSLLSTYPSLGSLFHFTPDVKELIQKLSQLEEELQIGPPWKMDTTLLEKSKRCEPVFESILIAGFGPEHDALLKLLSAAVYASKDASICILGKSSSSFESIWTAKWSNLFSEKIAYSTKLNAETPQIQKIQKETQVSHRIIEIAAPSIQKEADAVVQMALSFLNQPEALSTRTARIGILVPPDGILAREISLRFDELEIPYWDGVGHRSHDPNEENLQLWMRWQCEGTLTHWAEWIQKDSAQYKKLPCTEQSFKRICEDVLSETMLDHWETACFMISSFLENGKTPQQNGKSALHLFFKNYRLLPKYATLGQFLNESESIFREIGWKNQADRILSLFKSMEAHPLKLQCQRPHFLEWLKKRWKDSNKVRSKWGNHFFSCLCILSLAEGNECSATEWSHLILCGLNQNRWPLNKIHNPWIDLQKLEALRAKHGQTLLETPLILSHVELSSLIEKRIQELIESTPHVILSWSTYNETDNAERMLPSEFVLKLMEKKNSAVIDDSFLNKLNQITKTWLEQNRWPKDRAHMPEIQKAPIEPGLSQTSHAYHERRHIDQPFGIYNFALHSPPRNQPILAARKLALLLSQPEAIWMDTFLNVESDEPLNLFKLRKKILGTWVHRWLNDALNPEHRNEWIYLKKKTDAHASLEKAAEKTKELIEYVVHQGAGWKLPEIWRISWLQAKSLAHALLSHVFELEGFNWIRTEWSLPKPTALSIESVDHTSKESTPLKILLSGQIDLALAKSPAEKPNEVQGEVWVVDYKTGSDSIDARRLEKGQGAGIQLALYGLALLTLGSEKLKMGLVKKDEPIEPILTEEIFKTHALLWERLAKMQISGIFGQTEKTEYDFSRQMPLATLPIDKEILRNRRKLTFPELEVENITEADDD